MEPYKAKKLPFNYELDNSIIKLLLIQIMKLKWMKTLYLMMILGLILKIMMKFQ